MTNLSEDESIVALPLPAGASRTGGGWQGRRQGRRAAPEGGDAAMHVHSR